MKRKNQFKMPNCIIEDTTLIYSAKTVAAVIYSYSNHFGYCRLGLMRLSKLAGCAPATASQALSQLVARGYISSYKNYAYSAEHGRIVYRRITCVCTISTTKDFTFIPRNVLGAGLRHSTFAVYLYLRRVAGNASRAFPSLSSICKALCTAKATVCRAIKEQVSKGLVYLEHCIKANGSHTSNSYFFVQQVETELQPRKIKSVRIKRAINLFRKPRKILDKLVSYIIQPLRRRRKRYLCRGVVSFLQI